MLYEKNNVKLWHGSALEVLKTFPDESVQMVMTSPPYWTQRFYSGHSKEIGLEKTPEQYIDNLFEICKEIKRVLKKEGTFWLNIDDVYYGSGHGRADDLQGSKQITVKGMANKNIRSFFNKQRNLPHFYLKKKDLCLIPERLIIKLQQDGWYIRSKIIWHKPNAMPENVNDRPTNDYEFLFLLTKSNKYYFDYKAIKEKYTKPLNRWAGDELKVLEEQCRNCGGYGIIKEYKTHNVIRCNECKGKGKTKIKSDWDEGTGQKTYRNRNMRPDSNARNCRAVWAINTKSVKNDHVAKYPEELCLIPIEAGSKCGDIVLDPFCGSGTTGVVATKLGRKFWGIDLSKDYLEKIAIPRIEREVGLF